MPLLKPKDQPRVRKPPIDFPDGPGGREICQLETAEGARIYRSRTLSMRKRQKELCRWCGLWMAEDETTFDHDEMRSVHHDDRICKLVNGVMKAINAAVHKLCNVARGSQKRLSKLPVGTQPDYRGQFYEAKL